MNSIFHNKSGPDIEVKHTRSGRLVIPPLAGWSGERIFYSPHDGVPPAYVSPSLDSNAQYLLPSNMLERLKKQKLVQEPSQVEQKRSSTGSSSRQRSVKFDSSKNSTPRKRQKSTGKGNQRRATHNTNKPDLCQSELNLICSELPRTPQGKRTKTSACHLVSAEYGSPDTGNRAKKSLLPLLHSSSDIDARNSFSGRDSLAMDSSTIVMHHFREKGVRGKKNRIHQDSSYQSASQGSHFDQSQNATNSAVFTNLNPNVALASPNVDYEVEGVRQNASPPDRGCTPHSNGCEMGRKEGNQPSEVDKDICDKESSAKHTDKNAQRKLKLRFVGWERQSESKCVNPDQPNKISELSDSSHVRNLQKSNSDKKQHQERHKRKKGNENNESYANICRVAINESHPDNGTSGENKSMRHSENIQHSESATKICPAQKVQNKRTNNKKENKVVLKKPHPLDLSSLDVDILSEDDQDLSLKREGSRTNVSDIVKKQKGHYEVEDVRQNAGPPGHGCTPHSNCCEMGNKEGSQPSEVDKDICDEESSAKHTDKNAQRKLKLRFVGWERQSDGKCVNPNQPNKNLALLDSSRVRNLQKSNSDKKQHQERHKRKKGNEHNESYANTCSVAINESHPDNGTSGENKAMCHSENLQHSTSATKICPAQKVQNKDTNNKKENKVVLKKLSPLDLSSFDVDILSEDDQDLSLKRERSRTNVSDMVRKQAVENDDIFLKRTSKKSVGRTEKSLSVNANELVTHKSGALGKTVESDRVSIPSDDSESMYDTSFAEDYLNGGKVDTQKFNFKKHTTTDKFEERNSLVTGSCEKHSVSPSKVEYATDQLRVSRTVHSDIKKGIPERVYSYSSGKFDKSSSSSVCTRNEVNVEETGRKKSSEVRTKNFHQNASFLGKHEYAEIDILSEDERSFSSFKIQTPGLISKISKNPSFHHATEHLSDRWDNYRCGVNPASLAKSKLKLISEENNRRPGGKGCSRNHKETAVLEKNYQYDSVKNLIPALHDDGSNFSNLSPHDNFISSDDVDSDGEFTQSKKDLSRNKILNSSSSIDPEASANNLFKQPNFNNSCEEKLSWFADGRSSNQNTASVIDEKVVKQTSEKQRHPVTNSQNRQQKRLTKPRAVHPLNSNLSETDFFKSPFMVGTVVSPSPEISSPGKYLYPSGTAVRSVSLNDDTRSLIQQNRISYSETKPKTLKRSSHDFVKIQHSVSNVASPDSANVINNDGTVSSGEKFSQARRDLEERKMPVSNSISDNKKSGSCEQKNCSFTRSFSEVRSHVINHTKKKKQSPDQNTFFVNDKDEHEGGANENTFNPVVSRRKLKLKAPRKQDALPRADCIETVPKTGTIDSESMCLQNTEVEKDSPVFNSVTDDETHNDNSHLNITFTFSSDEDCGNSTNQGRKNQNSHENVIKEQELDHAARKNSSSSAKKHRHNVCKVSTPCGTDQNCSSLDRNLVDFSPTKFTVFPGVMKRYLPKSTESYSLSKGSVTVEATENETSTLKHCSQYLKGRDRGYHSHQKSENIKRRHKPDSAVDHRLVGNDQHTFAETSNFDNGNSHIKRSFSKNIALSGSSLDSDLADGHNFKMKSQNSKVPKSDPLVSDSTCSDSDDVLDHNFLPDSGCPPTGKNFTQNIVVFNSPAARLHSGSSDQDLLNPSHGETGYGIINQRINNEKQNKNANWQNSKASFDLDAKSRKRAKETSSKSVDIVANCLSREKLLKGNSKIEKNVPFDSRKLLSPIRSFGTSVVQNRGTLSCNSTRYVCTKDNVSAVTHGNTSAVEISNQESSEIPDRNHHDEQKWEKIKGQWHKSMKSPHSVPSDRCPNSADVTSCSSDSPLSDDSYFDSGRALNAKEPISFRSVDDDLPSSGAHQNSIFMRSVEENHQDAIDSQDDKVPKQSDSPLIRSDHKSSCNAAKIRSGGTRSHKHVRSKSDSLHTQDLSPLEMDTLQKTPERMFSNAGGKQSGVAKGKTKKKLGGKRKNDIFERKKSLINNDVNLKVDSDDSSTYSTSPPAPSNKVNSFSQKRRSSYTDKWSLGEFEIRRDEADLHEQQRKRPKMLPEQKSATEVEPRTRHGKGESVKIRKEDTNNILIITQLHSDQDSDFGINSEDLKEYNFTDEDSDTVYRNY